MIRSVYAAMIRFGAPGYVARELKRMRLWYWFLIISLSIGLVLVIVGLYIWFNGTYPLGLELTIYGAVIIAFVLAAGFQYFEGWRQRPLGITILAILMGMNGIIGLLVGLMTVTPLLSAVPHLVVAYNLRSRARWAWASTLVLDALFLVLSIIVLDALPNRHVASWMLAVFPLALPIFLSRALDAPMLVIGIVIGIFIIWYLMQQHVRAFFIKAPSTAKTKE